MARRLVGPGDPSRALVRWLVVAAVVLGLSQPRDFVWCHSDSGHSAVEDLDAGCCRAPAGEASCADVDAGSGSGGLDDTRRTGSDRCTDVLLEAPTRLLVDKQLDEPAAERASARLLAGSDTISPPPAARLSRDCQGAVRAAEHEITLTNVLRI